ncbi:coiled-coil domain-containing protein 42 homolog isoform X2 [Paramacrobiotus metropolitanus]|uniref:coiled-coil domain-containing protein 42 homolog isoform X2 n=1 Tax=Paramacrobiotus metropolitanus TaxID=2943436 RepID=UPI0024465473|nr:coiled-coil domain-containing protein 42 homolog isoform X2 [Paramacrobiotus metropolitanus]
MSSRAAPLKPRPQQIAETLHATAPTFIPPRDTAPSLTELITGSPRKSNLPKVIRASDAARKAARNNPEFVLGHIKRQSNYVRKPVTNEDHILRATRLIEAERMAGEVDEALKSVKDGFAAEMDRCLKRKQDSVRKNQALMTAMKDFSHFIQLNDHWIEHNRKREEDDQRLTAAYQQRSHELQAEQATAIRYRHDLRQRWRVLRPYEAFFLDLLKHITGYNDLEHFAADMERQTAIIECTRQTLDDLQTLRAEAEQFHSRLDQATESKVAKLDEETRKLEEEKKQLEEKVQALQCERQQDLENRKADIKEYIHLVVRPTKYPAASCPSRTSSPSTNRPRPN